MNKKKTSLGELPPYVIGTWAWGTGINGAGMIFGRKYDESTLIETFATARNLGFDWWDTAEVYGMGSAETLLGKCMEQYGNVKISTKFMPPKKYHRGKMLESLESSMSRLHISSPDIYWIHLPNNPIDNIAEAAELLNSGKIKAIGVSNFNLSQIQAADKYLRNYGIRLTAVQNHFSLLSMPQEQFDIIEWCNRNDIIYFSYMVMEQGALSGHYDENHHFPAFSSRNFQFGKSKFRKISPLLKFICNLSVKYNIDASQIAVIWAAAKGTIPIVGVTKPLHVKQLAASSEIVLEGSDIARLEQLAGSADLLIKGVWEPED